MYEKLQKLKCTVLGRNDQKPIYDVLIHDDEIKASLVCKEPLQPGDEVLGLFGAYLNGVYLLTLESNEVVRIRDLNKHRSIATNLSQR